MWDLLGTCLVAVLSFSPSADCFTPAPLGSFPLVWADRARVTALSREARKTEPEKEGLWGWRRGHLLTDEAKKGWGHKRAARAQWQDWPEKEAGSWGARRPEGTRSRAALCGGWSQPPWPLSSAPGVWTARRWVWKGLVDEIRWLCACGKCWAPGFFFFFFNKLKEERSRYGW